MACRYYGIAAIRNYCHAGSKWLPDSKIAEGFCKSPTNYVNCDRYKEQIKREIPPIKLEEIQEFVNKTITGVKAEIDKKFDEESMILKIYLGLILGLFLLVIFSILLYYNDSLAQKWWAFIIAPLIPIVITSVWAYITKNKKN